MCVGEELLQKELLQTRTVMLCNCYVKSFLYKQGMFFHLYFSSLKAISTSSI